MKITLSYSGGTSRGVQLAREFDKRGMLHEFYIPAYHPVIDLISHTLRPRSMEMDLHKVRANPFIKYFRGLMSRTRKLRGAKPSERYLVTNLIDQWVSSSLHSGADVLLVESQIALNSIFRAKQLGMVTILDRTNSHILYQSQVIDEELQSLGVSWKINSQRVIDKSLKEYAEADYIFTLSSYVTRTFLANGIPIRKIRQVPSGIDLSRFNPSQKKDNIFRVIYCGALQGKKGTHYLLRAFAELNLPNSELWLIGNPLDDMLPILKRYQDKYTALGQIPNTQLAQYYSQGSVFVLPSLEEGLAKVMIEAMACGLPVIATTNTGAEDVVREGVDGFVVPIRDVDSLKEKIQFMYENPIARQQMGQNAITRAHSEFTLEKYIERLLLALLDIKRTV